jgi:O-antigen ligase
MPPVLVLAAIECVLAAACVVVAGRSARAAALLLLAVTAPLEVYRTPVLGVNLSLFRLSLVVALVVVVVRDRHRILERARDPLVITYALLTATMVLSLVLLSDNLRLAARVTAQTASGVVAILCIAVLMRSTTLARVASFVAIGAVLPILAAVWQGLGPRIGLEGVLPLLAALPAAEGLDVTRTTNSFFGDVPRLRGTFGDPTHFGVYLAFVSALAVGAAAVALRRRAIPIATTYGLLALAAVLAIVGTYSRSAWLAVMAGACVMVVPLVGWIRRDDHPRWLLPALPAILAVGAVLVLAPLAPAIKSRLDSTQAANVVSNETHERTLTVATREFSHHPVLGIGLSDLGPELNQASRTSGAHSSYLTVAAELGGVGLALLLGGLALVIVRLRRALGSIPADGPFALALLAGYLGFAAASLFYDLWFDDFHWLFVGVIAGIPVARSLRAAPQASEPDAAVPPETVAEPVGTPVA